MHNINSNLKENKFTKLFNLVKYQLNKKMDEGSQINIDYLNRYIKNKSSFYDILSQQMGYFLPDQKSRCVTDSYLLNVATKKILIIKRDEMKMPPPLKMHLSINELIEILSSKCQGNELGFDTLTPPNKDWLISMLFHLAPQHEMFTGNFNENPFRDFPLKYFFFSFSFFFFVGFCKILMWGFYRKKVEDFSKKMSAKGLQSNSID